MKIQYLGINQILAIHERALELFGGKPGVLDLGLLEAAIHRPMSSAGLVDAFPDIFSKASTLLQLAAKQCFVDGNKRTAFSATLMFLEINGYVLTASPDEATEFVYKIACGAERNLRAIADWLKIHSVKGEQTVSAEEQQPIFDIQVNINADDSNKSGTMEFSVRAGYLAKDKDLFVVANRNNQDGTTVRLFKPRHHQDHIELVYKLADGDIHSQSYRLGNLSWNQDHKVALAFDNERSSIEVDGKPLEAIEFEDL